MTSVHPQQLSVWTARTSVKRKAQGFTLIEVLVVVAIIALLISVLLPSLKRAREQAKTLVCATNMRTIFQADLFYCQTNADYFPFNVFQDAGGNWKKTLGGFEMFYKLVNKGVPQALRDYSKCKWLGTIDLNNNYYAKLDWYICPNDVYYHPTDQGQDWVFPDGKSKHVIFVLSYGFATDNMYTRSNTAGNPANGSYKASGIKRPSNAVLFCEGGNDDTSGAGRWELQDFNDQNPQIEFELRHLTGQNIVYADGHVQFHKLMNKDLDSLGRNQYGLPPFPMAWIYNRTKLAYDGTDKPIPTIPGNPTFPSPWTGRFPPRATYP